MNVNLNSGKKETDTQTQTHSRTRVVIVTMSKFPAVLAERLTHPPERHSGYCGPTTLDLLSTRRVHMENVDDGIEGRRLNLFKYFDAETVLSISRAKGE